MAVAYSDSEIVRSTLDGTSAAAMISDLNTVAVAAGWNPLPGPTGGFKYMIRSPQGYEAHVLIQDDLNYKIDNPAADLYNFRSMVIVFYNVAETVKSFDYQVKANGTFGLFQVIAGVCQLFISVPAVANGAWASVAGGIPFVPPAAGFCAVDAPVTITDIWWACGGSQFPYGFREQANCYACMTYYRNGVAVVAADNNNTRPFDGLLCLFPLTAVNTYSSDQIPWPTITYSSNRPLAIDAFVGWDWSIRGQLWDAYLQTAAGTLDAIVNAEDTGSNGLPFIVRSITWHSQFYSSLQLVYEIEGGGFGNVAY